MLEHLRILAYSDNIRYNATICYPVKNAQAQAISRKDKN